MNRWAVDITGIDIDSDILKGQNKAIHRDTGGRAREQWRATFDSKFTREREAEVIGEVWILQPDELMDLQEEKLRSTLLTNSPFATGCPSNQGERSINHSHSVLSSATEPESPKAKDIRVFCTFLSAQGKLTVVTVTMTQPQYRGIDIVNAFLQQAIAPDERLSQRFSANPRLYRLCLADEFTGEEGMTVQLDIKVQNVSCYAVNPLPAAKLYLFPQRTELIPPLPNDINLIVNIRTPDPQAKPLQRQCVVPADMFAEKLESTLTRRLPASGIVTGSLRIKYGPLELNINEYYNFGAGCGHINCPIAERTMLSLYRLGVTEVVVNGRSVEECASDFYGELAEDIVISMDVEEALSFQQFEVICINRYGARQQRMLCVDGDHLYTMRPNSDSIPKTTERPIKEIEEVRLFPNKPKYMEIEYSRASRFEEDHIECTTTYNLALLDEKLRIVRRELRKRAEQEAMAVEEKTRVQKFFMGLRDKWFQ